MLRLIALLLFVAACRGAADAPPCTAVGAKVVLLAKRDLEVGKVDDETRRLVLDQLPAMRDSLVNACTDSAWDGAVRKCLVDATDHELFEQCYTRLTTVQRDALAKSAAGQTAEH